MTRTFTTIDVNFCTKDEFKEADHPRKGGEFASKGTGGGKSTKQAAETPEEAKRAVRGSATEGKTLAGKVHGKPDAQAQIHAAAEAHGKRFGAEHGAAFKAAAEEHHAKLEKKAAGKKPAEKKEPKGEKHKVLGRTRKIGGELLKSLMRANEETKL